jgi:hypothetical protein
MSAATLMIDRTKVFQRVHDVRAAWTSRERCQRAREGQHRFQKFLGLIAESPSESEIWAVGAPTDTDLKLLAGQH